MHSKDILLHIAEHRVQESLRKIEDAQREFREAVARLQEVKKELNESSDSRST